MIGRRWGRLGVAAAMVAAGGGVLLTAPQPATADSAADHTLAVQGGSFPERFLNQLMLNDTQDMAKAAGTSIAPSYFDANVDQARDNFVSGEADVAATEFPLTSQQTTGAAARKFAYVPIAATGVALGVVLVCNPQGKTVASAVCPNLQVTAAQAEGLFTNRIISWNDASALPTISGGTGTLNPSFTTTVVAQNQVVPSAANYEAEAYFENDATAKPLWETWLTSQGSVPKVGELWPTNKGLGEDMDMANALLPLDPATAQLPANPQLWAQKANLDLLAADWLGAPWGIPTLAVQNQAGTFVNPTLAAETAAINGATMDPTTHLVTFPPNGGTNAAAYPIMAVDYLVVPTAGLSAAKAAALAQFIKYIYSADGAKVISSFGSVPVTAAMADAGTAVANELAATTTDTSATTTTTTAAASTDAAATTADTSASTMDQSSAPSLAATGTNTALVVGIALFLTSVGVLGRRGVRGAAPAPVRRRGRRDR
jgi:hypothetical protein